MLNRIVLACVAAVVAYLVCVFIGGVLGVPIAVAIGKFLEQYASVIAVLVFLWYFFSGASFSLPRPTPPHG